MSMKLHNFFRSGTSHRLRIALNLKGLSYDYLPIDLRTEQHLGVEYKALNPQGLVPALVVGDRVLIQSPAIIEWLEERYPTPALLPSALDDRARVRALAAIVGCDIHPVNNRRILETLRRDFGAMKRECNVGARPGSQTDSTRSKRSSPATRSEVTSASAVFQQWPTSTWCHRSKAPAASSWTLHVGRSSSQSTRHVAASRRFERLSLPVSPTCDATGRGPAHPGFTLVPRSRVPCRSQGPCSLSLDHLNPNGSVRA